mmetsp:Transcript_34284/g.61751  ORF Transcript_34284/g.61751 Transcript_34284/m.61751 type:complete len:261 (-) Transcript_34284:1740-2522(-)
MDRLAPLADPRACASRMMGFRLAWTSSLFLGVCSKLLLGVRFCSLIMSNISAPLPIISFKAWMTRSSSCVAAAACFSASYCASFWASWASISLCCHSFLSNRARSSSMSFCSTSAHACASISRSCSTSAMCFSLSVDVLCFAFWSFSCKSCTSLPMQSRRHCSSTSLFFRRLVSARSCTMLSIGRSPKGSMMASPKLLREGVIDLRLPPSGTSRSETNGRGPKVRGGLGAMDELACKGSPGAGSLTDGAQATDRLAGVVT